MGFRRRVPVNNIDTIPADQIFNQDPVSQGAFDSKLRSTVSAPITLQTGQAPESNTYDDLTPKNKDKTEVSDAYKGLKIGLAAAEFGIDMMNANSRYRTISDQAQFNIVQAQNQRADSLYRGRLAAGRAESKGRQAGEQSLLALAAQGQDVSGAAAQRVQGSYEAVGIENALQEEINSMREALGFELEQIGYDYQIKTAGIERDASVISSGLQFISSSVGVL